MLSKDSANDEEVQDDMFEVSINNLFSTFDLSNNDGMDIYEEV